MMLIGRIAKQEGPFWSADCDAIGAFTQGTSRAAAVAALVTMVQVMVKAAGLADEFAASALDIGRDPDGSHLVLVDSTQPELLAALVLKYQREIHKLSLADVAKKLGTSNRSSYAAYEQGRREPSLSKFRELLAVVAPDMALIVGPRASSAKRKVKSTTGRSR